MREIYPGAVIDAERERLRTIGVFCCMLAGVAAYFVHPAAAVAVFGLALVLTLADWRMSSTAALGVFLVATMLVSANYRLTVPSPIDLTGNRLALGVLLVAWFAGQLEVTRTWPVAAKRINVPLGWLFAVALVTLVLNQSQLAAGGTVAGALKRMAALVSFILAYSLVLALVKNRTEVIKTMKLLVWLGVIGSGVAIIERLSGTNPSQRFLEALPFEKYQFTEAMTRAAGIRAYGTAGHPIEFGAMMALLLPVAVYLILSTRGLSRIAYLLASAAIAVGMLFSVSRSSLIAAVIALLVLAALSTPTRGVVLLAAVVAIGAIAVSVFTPIATTLERMLDPQWITREEAAAHSGRMKDWPIVWEMVKTHPLVGVGYDLFEAKKYFFLDNQYLKFVLELGIVGLGIVFWFFVTVARVGWGAVKRARTYEETPAEAALLGALAGFVALSALFDTFGFFQVTNLFFVMVGLLVVLASSAPHRKTETGP